VADGRVLMASGQANVLKMAIEPVWWLPGVAERFGCDEETLRRHLFTQVGSSMIDRFPCALMHLRQTIMGVV
jgi:hypothetical protein